MSSTSFGLDPEGGGVDRSGGGEMPLSEEEARGWFHLVERATVVRKGDEETGRIMHAEIQLSEWVYNSIRRKSVLTLHRDYFRLRKPIERRVYEIARKLCGMEHLALRAAPRVDNITALEGAGREAGFQVSRKFGVLE